MMNLEFFWFLGWSALLAFVLFFPVSKMIWVLSVRRLRKRLGRELDARESAGQLNRARFIAFFLVVPFSLLFQYGVFGMPSFQ